MEGSAQSGKPVVFKSDTAADITAISMSSLIVCQISPCYIPPR